MKPLDEARTEVLAAMPQLPSDTVDPGSATGRVTSVAAVAAEFIPPFDNSAMDGFAVVASDCEEGPVTLAINEDIAAGSVPLKAVVPGTATRIMTGAPMPDGANAVVRVEDTEVDGRGTVTILAGVTKGKNVRLRGGDMSPGDVIVDAGVRLSARHVATLASAGVDPVVADLPTVALMSTGDEIVDHSTRNLAPGTIRDSNRVLLRALLTELGVPFIDLGIVGDDPDELRAAYHEAANDADTIISTGGVSMGDYDYVKQVLGELGSVEFWTVAMQPGKPFAFGSINGVPLFGLPGNPVSTFVSFEQFVRPAILHMMGATNVLRTRIVGTMGEDVRTHDAKTVFLRVLLAQDTNGTFVAVQSGGQGSHMHSSLANADAFAVVPEGVGTLSAGDDVMLEMFRWPEGRSIDE
jgi:molybdenum cofactor synthesis domain-containing protein